MVSDIKESKEQRSLIRTKAKTKNTLFLEGPAGTGKTLVGVRRMRYLLSEELATPDSLLLLVPQRTLAGPYQDALYGAGKADGGLPPLMTLGSLAQQTIEFFWPMIAAEAGFAQPMQPPVFLTLETAQYYMARLIGPRIDREGLFDAITVDRNRLYSQMIDALNKAAVAGFSVSEIGARLSRAWVGEEAQRRAYADLQDCVTQFRQFCYDHNLLDYALQIELFAQRLWHLPECRNYLIARYRHIIFDNIEEDHPTTHAIIRDWLPHVDSALLIYDTDAGYRRFLGADPDSAYALKPLCKRRETFTHTYVNSLDMQALADELSLTLGATETTPNIGDARAALRYDDHRFQPQLIEWVADEIAGLVHGEGMPPGEIVVLSSYLSDAVRFTLINRLAEREIPARSHRPSRALREETPVRALLTLAQIAHPDWRISPAAEDVTVALMTAIDGLDLVRAGLLAQIVYRARGGLPELGSFDALEPGVQARITYDLGGRYETLRGWLAVYCEGDSLPLDHFWSRLFGEVLSQPGFGFHNAPEAATLAANLIDSARSFRQIIHVPPEGITLEQEYIQMVNAGLIADQYLRGWHFEDQDAVLLAPAYTYLMRNQPVTVQFWLNVGGRGWAERLYQPLTHPYVLSQYWDPSRPWTDADETAAGADALYRLVIGLARRCRRTIYLGYSELSEGGYEQRGALLDILQRTLRRLIPPQEEMPDV